MSDWKNVQYKDGKLRTNNGGSGGASALSDLTDVDLTNITDGQILKWDDTNSKWINANESGGGSGHTYSTTEQLVGKWTDGSDLFEITIDQTINADTDYTVFASGISFGFLVHSMLEWSSNRWMSPSYRSLVSTNSSKSCYVDVRSGALYLHNQSSSSVHWKAVIRYTKTTS